MAQQSFATHRRLVPMYHLFTGSLLLLNLVYSVWQLWVHHTLGTVVGLAVAIALIMFFHFARHFPKVAQDRVIRLEESLRYQKVLPPDLRERTAQLTLRQIIGLRFAGDQELAGLVRRALDEHLTENQIKRAVTQWRADELRV